MEALIIIILLVVGIYLYKKFKTPSKINIEPKINVSISTRSGPINGSNNIDTGTLKPTKDNGFVINPKSPFPLTIYNLSQKEAGELKTILDEGLSEGSYKVIQKLRPLIAKTNLECKEIQDYVKKFKPIFLAEIERLKSTSSEWQTASEGDRQDLLVSFKEKALSALEVRPYCDLEILFEGKPSDSQIDDPLLERYGYDLTRLYLSFSGRRDKTFTIPADHPDRKNFEKLVEMGLAISGDSLPLEEILQTLKLKEMSELVEDLNPPKLTRKAKAIEFLLTLPDIKKRVGKKVAFRSLFKLNPLPEEFSQIDLHKIRSVWKWEEVIAFLLSQTYASAAYASRRIKQDTEDLSYIKGWEVLTGNDESSCPYCQSLSNKIYPKNKYPKIPFHIGCRCTVVPKM